MCMHTQYMSQHVRMCRRHAPAAPDLDLDALPVQTLSSNTAQGLQNLCHILKVRGFLAA